MFEIQKCTSKPFILTTKRYINKRPEVRGKPVLFTNADVSVSAGFENREYMNIAVQNYTGVVLSRYEAIDCRAYGEHFSGYQKRCHCGEGTDECYDSFILTYPLPPQLEEKGHVFFVCRRKCEMSWIYKMLINGTLLFHQRVDAC